MNNCCIEHKLVNNINGSTIVTLNGRTDFIDIADLEAASGSFKNLSFSEGFGAYAEIITINSTTIENQENIQTNTFTATTSAQIAQITISKNNITGNADNSAINVGNINFSVDGSNNTTIAQTSQDASLNIQNNGTIQLSFCNNNSIIMQQDNVIINVPVQLSDSPGSSDYVCHLPQGGTQVTYKWPSPPGFLKKKT